MMPFTRPNLIAGYPLGQLGYFLIIPIMVSSQLAVPCLMWSGGLALSENDTLGRARQERRSVAD